ncbi:MAG: ATP-binding protein [Deltaproteobacteria bacterium]|nr:ATP-binding protein [Deltaproteobacteria bacterium]
MERLVKTYIFDPEMTAGKMIFLVGPRQVGKTHFARKWLAETGFSDTYFSWDDPAVMKAYRSNPLYFRNTIAEHFQGEPVPIVFDELHKHKNWRDILKGFYDTHSDRMRLLITGSARLGMYRKSGDSLIGRYFSYQMFPLGVPEMEAEFSQVIANESTFTVGETFLDLVRGVSADTAKRSLDDLMAYGGFPEPLLRGSVKFHRRWQQDYKSLLIREDVRDLSRIVDIKGLEQLVEILPGRVGSPLSLNSLREDLSIHYGTIANWLNILQALYLVFTIRPWHKNLLRSLKKESKLYFYDWSLIADPAIRFENLLAVSLIRMAARFTESGLGVFEIMYLRDTAKREVDFILIKDGDPVALFEAKEHSRVIDPSGRYFSRKLSVPYYQILRAGEKPEAFPDNCYIIPATQFLMLTG